MSTIWGPDLSCSNTSAQPHSILGGQRVVGSINPRLVPRSSISKLVDQRSAIRPARIASTHYTTPSVTLTKDTRSPNLLPGRNRGKKRLYLCCTTVATSAEASLSYGVAYSVIFLSIDHSLATFAACSPCRPASTSRIWPQIGDHCRHYWALSSRGPYRGLALPAARPAAALHHRYQSFAVAVVGRPLASRTSCRYLVV